MHRVFRSCQAVALRKLVLLFLLLIVFRLSVFAALPAQERADRFLALANARYQTLFRVNSEAQWTGGHRCDARACLDQPGGEPKEHEQTANIGECCYHNA